MTAYTTSTYQTRRERGWPTHLRENQHPTAFLLVLFQKVHQDFDLSGLEIAVVREEKFPKTLYHSVSKDPPTQSRLVPYLVCRTECLQLGVRHDLHVFLDEFEQGTTLFEVRLL